MGLIWFHSIKRIRPSFKSCSAMPASFLHRPIKNKSGLSPFSLSADSPLRWVGASSVPLYAIERGAGVSQKRGYERRIETKSNQEKQNKGPQNGDSFYPERGKPGSPNRHRFMNEQCSRTGHKEKNSKICMEGICLSDLNE